MSRAGSVGTLLATPAGGLVAARRECRFHIGHDPIASSLELLAAVPVHDQTG
jgi:hypothetical protein